MLSILNRLCHGYVGIPVIIALKKQNFFNLLSFDVPQRLTFLCKTLEANPGHFRVALRLLESLGWILNEEKRGYRLTDKAQAFERIPEEIIKLYTLKIESSLLTSKRAQLLLNRGLNVLLEQEPTSKSFQLLQGPVLVPLLLSMRQKQETFEDTVIARFFEEDLSPPLRGALSALFRELGWISLEGFVLSEMGREMIKNAYVLGIAASYRPMLLNMSELLFGKAAFVFKRNSQGQEIHIDRSLNVIASGTQHERYFQDAESRILNLFDESLPLEQQPQYIADMGCGDGSFLKGLYQSIQEKRERGKHLNEFPLKLIGVDYNQAALEESEKTLEGLPHITLKGDINDPEKLLSDLKELGIGEVERVLHVRSFLDHNFRYSTASFQSQNRKKLFAPIFSSGVYVDASGRSLSSDQVLGAWKEHLRKWANALAHNPHGIFVLESHCLDAQMTGQYFEQSENFYFDALHAFSGQYLLDAEAFIILAANVGLFAKTQPLFYPKILPFCRVSLSHFEVRDYLVRHARVGDLTRLQNLERACWVKALQTPKAVLVKRLQAYPEGQFVLELEGKVIGCIYSQRIESKKALKGVNAKDVFAKHCAQGALVQLLAVNIDPDFQTRQFGDQLLEFMLQRCSVMTGVEAVVGVTLCRDYHQQKDWPIEVYIQKRDEHGLLCDSILRFHERHGAQVVGLVPEYRPEDGDNEGFGVLVEYDIHNRRRKGIEVKMKTSFKEESLDKQNEERGGLSVTLPNSGCSRETLEVFLEDLIKTLLGSEKTENFSQDRPLMEMGLNSADLLEISEQISVKFQRKLEPAFFFQYNTLKRIISYLEVMSRPEKPKEAPSGKEEFSSAQAVHPKEDLNAFKLKTKGEKVVFVDPGDSQEEDIAIIGMSCRLPGDINSPEELWAFLKEEKSAIGRMPEGRWVWPKDIDLRGEHEGIDRGGFLEDIEYFDASFFRLSPREVEVMDPQQRILLELAWEVLEDSGYSADNISQSQTGVFIGASGSDYRLLLEQKEVDAQAHMGIGNSMAVLANRISYFYDFHGPSMQIDTACSSSLVAVHEAVEALQTKKCAQALVGGVNIICHPGNTISYYKAGMLSRDGLCKAFDEKANGYVRSEGAVMLMFKPLRQALTDKDRIHALIKGTSSNHGGQASGLTVPNPEQQAKLLKEAWGAAKVTPESIGYIEAHGTGTKLGDPIEVRGLKEAFSQGSFSSSPVKADRCGLSSIKTNLGHLEAAAGIAGLLKLVLSLKHQELAPSINFNKLNQHIDFSGSPFYIVKKHQFWPLPKGQRLRRAGVNSFGSGGANAHVVVEEYQGGTGEDKTPLHLNPRFPELIVLSAKNEERLKAYAQKLAAYLGSNAAESISMDSIAYTLQRRQMMEERVVFMVHSLSELKNKLECLAQGVEQIEGSYRGGVKEGRDVAELFHSHDEMSQVLEKWIAEGAVRKIAKLWVKGVDVNWELFYETKPIRINLPAYPFARERYWINEISDFRFQNSDLKNQLHPLLHENRSDFKEQRFSSTFTGEEFFLADHVVKGQKMLPGVVYLEMARAAVEETAGSTATGQSWIQLKNFVWVRPIAVNNHAQEVHIGLFPEENGQIQYEIYSKPEKDFDPATMISQLQLRDDMVSNIVHSQGVAIFNSSDKVPPLDLPALQEVCNQSRLSSEQCSAIFKTKGIDYGPSHQGIEKVYVGSSQALAKLSLPSHVLAMQDEFVLHPEIMDSALQASIGLFLAGDDNCSNSSFPSMPFGLQSLEIFERCPCNLWMLIRSSEGPSIGHGIGSTGRDKVQKLDMDLCNDQGSICVRIRGLERRDDTKAVSESLAEAKLDQVSAPFFEETSELMTFEETWQEEALSKHSLVEIKALLCFLSRTENQQAFVEAMKLIAPQTKVLFIHQGGNHNSNSDYRYGVSRTDRNTYEKAFRRIREDHGEVDAILYLWPLEDSRCIQDLSCQVYILQAMASNKLSSRRFLSAGQFKNRLDRCFLESWMGFERSLGLILPQTQVANVYQKASAGSRKTTMQDWMQKLWGELQSNKVQSALYKNGKRYICRIYPINLKEEGESHVKQRGTYLITGGCGGLGFLFAEHLAKTYTANLVLTGRSLLTPEKQSRIQSLEKSGSSVFYLQSDLCDARGMKEGMKIARKRLGPIHGVLHAAGIIGSKSLFENEIQSFQKVLAPKIKGTLILDEILGEEPLDFIGYFSSSSAILGDFGSCDYAIGNRFQTAYTAYRNELQTQGKRSGKAIVMNWPLWKNGGMGSADDEQTYLYLKSSGQHFLETREGLALFERLLSQDKTQHLILFGQPGRVHRFLGLTQALSAPSSSSIAPAFSKKGRRPEMRGLSVEDCVRWDLKKLMSQILKITRDKLDRETNLADYGFDSISLAEFARLLTEHYGFEITPALFFGHSTLEKLTRYFLTKHKEMIQGFYQEDAGTAKVFQLSLAIPKPKWPHPMHARILSRSAWQSVPEPIAIIGMSGRFSQARDIEAMWKILLEGTHAVEEIPADRFDWRRVYGDPTQDSHKTNCKWCGCIPGVAEFDPLFFEISPREAETMDPRQRHLLQESWKALEDAGYGAHQIQKHKIGMFVGVEEGDYGFLAGEGNVTSNHNGILAARLAYFLNFHGPTMAINTACSSSLVAAHQACLSLRNQECDTALAAGVNLMFSPDLYVAMAQVGMLSSEGKCFAFDKRANGMVPGEAVAVVVLKRLSRAESDGDPIHAIIRGSGINYDGKTNGITAPSGLAQTDLIKSVYQLAQINPEEIDYIVTHGTGTKLGDPVEINALYDAFKDATQKRGYCALTSTKTNFGHTFAASGLVSMISLVQALRHKMIPRQSTLRIRKRLYPVE